MPTLTVYKSREEIEESLRGVKRLFVLRCGVCSALWWEHSAEAKRRLEAYLSDTGIEVIGNRIVFCPCVPYGLHARFLQFEKQIERADAIGMVSCPLGVNSVHVVTKRKKPVIPFFDVKSIYCCAYYNEPANLLLSPCSGCGQCVLGLTEGICTVDNCPRRLRLPCRKAGEIVRECKEDPARDCPFFFIKEKGLLDGLVAYERAVRRKERAGESRTPLIEVSRPLKGRKLGTKRTIASVFARLSGPLASMTAVTDQPPVRKIRF